MMADAGAVPPFTILDSLKSEQETHLKNCKSLTLFQGLEWKSFIWCWLCVCTDFFSIFFIVSWLFLSNEHINGEFLGCFSVIGEVWCWKVMIAVVPFSASVMIVYVCNLILYFLRIFTDDSYPYISKMCLGVMSILCIFASALFLFVLSVFILIIILFMEMLCFSILAAVLWKWCSINRWKVNQKHVAEAITTIHRFIHNASHQNNDRIIRIMAINFAYDPDNVLGDWCLERKEKSELRHVTYREIREKANTKNTSLCYQIWTDYKELIAMYSDLWSNSVDFFFEELPLALMITFLVSFIPFYLLTRIATVLYPYYIIGYLWHYGLWEEMNLFEMVMLGTYIGLQMMILILGVFVFRTHYWLWHVAPGQRTNWPKDLNTFLWRMDQFYNCDKWIPIAQFIVMDSLGPDIGHIVWDYLQAITETAIQIDI